MVVPFPEGSLGKLRADCVVATSTAVVLERNFRLALCSLVMCTVI